MTESPVGWALSRLADVAEVRLGRQRSPKNATGNRMRPYLRAANVKWEGLELSDVNEMAFTEAESETYELRAGDLLLGEASGSPSEVGKPGQYRGEIEGCCFQNTLLRVRLPDGLLADFYEHYFREQALNGKFAAGSRGVGIRHLGAAALSDWTIPVPSLAEQRRIVTAIEEAFSKLDAGEAGLRITRQLLRRIREAVLAAAVTGLLVPQKAAEAPSTKLLADLGIEFRDDAGLTGTPIGWASVTLGDLVSPGRRIAYGVLQPGGDVADGVRLVRVLDLADGTVAIPQLKRISPAIASKFPRTALAGGEVLLSVVGTIGRVAVVPDSLRGVNVARAVAVLPLRSDVVLPEWIAYALRHEPRRRALEEAAHEVARKTLNLEDVRRFPLPVPPIDEQRRIVTDVTRHFSFLDSCERAVDAARARSVALRRSILKAGFEGRLVPQDPSDEPAAVLLERIHAKRATSAEPASGRRRRKAEAS